MYKILTKEMLTPTICRMKVEAPRLAASAQPGQFLIVRADEKGERIPLTISDYDKNEGSVTIVTQQIGASTSEICSYEVGDCFADVVGPLGIPSDFTEMSADELAGKKYDQAVAIGPMIMMKFATLTCKKLELPVIVSLNTLMVDGTGMCGACRVTVGGKVRFACVEGPEFDGYLVDFDEAMRRQRMYNTEERDANEHHVCRIGRGK